MARLQYCVAQSCRSMILVLKMFALVFIFEPFYMSNKGTQFFFFCIQVNCMSCSISICLLWTVNHSISISAWNAVSFSWKVMFLLMRHYTEQWILCVCVCIHNGFICKGALVLNKHSQNLTSLFVSRHSEIRHRNRPLESPLTCIIQEQRIRITALWGSWPGF